MKTVNYANTLMAGGLGLVLAGALWAAPSIRTGASPHFLVDAWETDQGLPENSTRQVVQMPDGSLWFGTMAGLVRFNGDHFEVLTPGNTASLPSEGIGNLHLDGAQRLWVSTLRGLVVSAPGRWRTFQALPVVQGDRTLLRQVMANLLSKAVKFTRGRPVAVIAVAAEAGADPRLATIGVGDNGVGFNPKYQEKLFGVFERLHTAREFDGLGIGLAIVRRIVERHGGKIWAEGSVDKGAKFHFTVPLPHA